MEAGVVVEVVVVFVRSERGARERVRRERERERSNTRSDKRGEKR